MSVEIVITILLVLMIIGAIVAIEVKDLLSGVVSVGVVGIILSLLFLFLQAPDLAIVQLVVEILALVILIRATVVRDATSYSGQEICIKTITIIGAIIFIYFSYLAIKQLPVFGKPIMRVSNYYIEKSLSETGAANIVSAIILNYRGYDTLGEATVLFTAVVGVLAVMRKIGRKK